MLMKMRKYSKKCSFTFIFLFVSSYLFSSFYIAPYRDEINLPYFDAFIQIIFPDDISCFFRDDVGNVSLKAAEDHTFSDNSLFFHETSCKKYVLTLRKACAVEAAARANPFQHIVLLFTRPIKDAYCYKKVLDALNLPNVELSRIHIEKYTKNSPLENVFKKGLNRRVKKYKLVAELLKYLTLYKYGGMVMDLDLILTKKLDLLGSIWLARENDRDLGTAVMKVEKNELGRRFVGMILRSLKDQPYLDESSGQKALTEAYQQLCSTSSISNVTAENCRGFEVYNSTYFYPINRTSRHLYYNPGQLSDQPYGYHLWNTDDRRRSVPAGSLLVKISRKFCPVVFNKFIFEFVKYD